MIGKKKESDNVATTSSVGRRIPRRVNESATVRASTFTSRLPPPPSKLGIRRRYRATRDLAQLRGSSHSRVKSAVEGERGINRARGKRRALSSSHPDDSSRPSLEEGLLLISVGSLNLGNPLSLPLSRERNRSKLFVESIAGSKGWQFRNISRARG